MSDLSSICSVGYNIIDIVVVLSVTVYMYQLKVIWLLITFIIEFKYILESHKW